MRNTAVLAVLLLASPVVRAQSQTVTIDQMDVRQTAGTIELLLAERADASLTKALMQTPLSRGWIVQSVETATGATHTLTVEDVIVHPTLPVLTLRLASRSGDWLDTSTHTITVTFLRSASLARAVSAPTAAAPGAVRESAFEAAPSAALADVYFSGKITGTAGDTPKYSFEAKLQNDWELPRHRGALGYLAEVAADAGTKADPDRISVGVTYRRVIDPRPRGTILHVQPLAGEFSRNAPRTTTMLTTAQVEHVLVPTTGSPAARFAMVIFGGTEIGTNRSNAIDKEHGSGFVRRLRVAANPFLLLQGKGPFKAVKASAFWDVRFLTSEEIDPGERDALGLPTLTKRTRQHLKIDLDLAVNRFVSLTLQHRGGYLPPTYKKVTPTITVSLTFKGKWV
jgi:hypothetical protein